MIKKLLTIMLLLITIGCVKTGVLMLTDSKYPPKPKNYNVQVFLDKEPTRPYKKIAIVDAIDEIEAKDSRVEALEKFIEKLQKKCREIGADAIIIIGDAKSLSSLNPGTKFKTAFQVQGYAIVWEQ